MVTPMKNGNDDNEAEADDNADDTSNDQVTIDQMMRLGGEKFSFCIAL